MREHVQVFWQPGCTSCLRTKEFLKAQGIEFEAVDVVNDSDGLARLEALGARGIPVVAIGERWVFAQSTKVVAEFLGVPLNTSAELDAPTLVQRLSSILDAALRHTRQLPPEAFATKIPGSDRVYGELAWHIFHVAAVFLRAEAGGTLTFAGLAETLPSEVKNTSDVIAYGTRISQAISAYWEREADRSGTRLVDTFYGKHTLRDVLERTAWHSGQHLRQLVSVLRALGVEPDRPLGAEDFAGLPMPASVWDEKIRLEEKARA